MLIIFPVLLIIVLVVIVGVCVLVLGQYLAWYSRLVLSNFNLSLVFWLMQGWGVAVLVGVPNKDAVFMTKPINVLNERTLKGTFFGNYKPRTDLPSVVDMYMNKVLSFSYALTSFGFLYTCLM